MREEQVVGHDEPSMPFARLPLPATVGPLLARHTDMAVAHRDQAREGMQGGGLARPIGTEQRDDLAGPGAHLGVESEGAAIGDHVPVEVCTL
jgi:hypothetical protein